MHQFAGRIRHEAGEDAQARATLDAGFAKAEQVGERYSEIELWRVRAAWALRQGDPAEADRCLQQALDQARACGARGYELRAATAIHRLLAGRGDPRALAASPLPALLASFDEGHDTADVQQAQAALAAAPTPPVTS